MSVLFYILSLFVWRFVGFFEHWYVGGFKFFTSAVLRIWERIAMRFGMTSIRSIFGSSGGLRALSRISIGAALAASVSGAAILLYGAWLFIPPAVIFMIVINLPMK